MAKKLPKPFKPQFKPKEFEKKILKRIFLPEEKEFLKKFYSLDPQGLWIFSPDALSKLDQLPKEDLKHLQKLGKEIQKNTGIVDPVKLGLAGIITAGILIFFVVFFDAIIRDLVIRGMQGIFGAKVEVTGLNFKPWEGIIHFEGLQIANKEKPMENLAEFSRAMVDVDMGAIFQGKAVIKHLTAKEMRFGTSRKTSGALDSSTPVKDPQSPMAPMKLPVVELPFLKQVDLGNINPQQLFDQAIQNFQTTAFVKKASQDLVEKKNRWGKTIEDQSSGLKRYGETAEKLLKTDLKTLKTPTEIAAFVKDIGTAVEQGKALAKDFQGTASELKNDVTFVGGLREDLQKNIKKDWETVSKLIQLPAQGPVSLVGALVSPYLYNSFGNQIQLINQALKISASLKDDTQKKPVKITPQRLGQDFPFPTVTYPNFHLRDMEVSLGSRDKKDLWELIIRDATSDPEWVGKPLTVTFTRLDGSQTFQGDLSIDFRKNASNLLVGKVKLMGIPGTISEGLESIGAKKFTSEADWEGEILVKPEASWDLSAQVTLRQPDIQWVDTGEVQGLVTQVLRTANPLSIKIKLSVSPNNTALTVDSNLDEAMTTVISQYLKTKFQDLQNKLKKVFDDWVTSQSGTLIGDLKSWDAMVNTYQQNLTQITQWEQSLNKKKMEAEKTGANFLQNQAGNLGIQLPQGLPKF